MDCQFELLVKELPSTRKFNIVEYETRVSTDDQRRERAFERVRAFLRRMLDEGCDVDEISGGGLTDVHLAVHWCCVGDWWLRESRECEPCRPGCMVCGVMLCGEPLHFSCDECPLCARRRHYDTAVSVAATAMVTLSVQ
jgi:hypothetical protein